MTTAARLLLIMRFSQTFTHTLAAACCMMQVCHHAADAIPHLAHSHAQDATHEYASQLPNVGRPRFIPSAPCVRTPRPTARTFYAPIVQASVREKR